MSPVLVSSLLGEFYVHLFNLSTQPGTYGPWLCVTVYLCAYILHVISNLTIFYSVDFGTEAQIQPFFVGISVQLIIYSWGNSAYIYAICQHSQGPTAPGCMCGYVHT
jgi:hypothetical protein